MKKIIATFAAALCAASMLCVPVSAEESDVILPSGAAVSDFGSAMEQLAAQNKKDGRVYASAAVGIFRGDEVLYTGYFGQTDIAGGIDAADYSVYEWGSISKTFVWVSAMQLWEQGRLDLNADIRTYLPEGFFHNLSYDDPITFMNLMNHNAGWQETVRQIETEDSAAILPLKDALQLCEPAQIHRPGEVTAYSNYGAALAGYIVECVSGTDYCEYVHRNILELLGMEHTSVSPDHSDNNWVRVQREKLHCYRFQVGKTIDLGNCLSYIMPYPAGAVTGTLGDMMIYGQALVNDDAPLFANKETQELLLTGTAFFGSSDIPSCCHGFWTEEYAVRTYGHGGATNAGQANLIFDPVSKVGLAVMVNEPDGNMFLNATPSIVFGALTPDRFVSADIRETTISGHYLMSRSTYRGLARFLPYITAASLDEKAYDIGNNVLLLGDESGGMILGRKTYPDGTEALELGSMEYIKDDAYIAELLLFTLYMIFTIAALYFIRIKRKLKKAGRYTAYTGARVMGAGDWAIVVSFVTWIGSFAVYSAFSSLPTAAGAAIGVVQIICMAVCAVSAVGALVSLAAGKQRTRPHIYMLSAVLHTVAVVTVLYYEMYVFWGC